MVFLLPGGFCWTCWRPWRWNPTWVKDNEFYECTLLFLYFDLPILICLLKFDRLQYLSFVAFGAGSTISSSFNWILLQFPLSSYPSLSSLMIRNSQKWPITGASALEGGGINGSYDERDLLQATVVGVASQASYRQRTFKPVWKQ